MTSPYSPASPRADSELAFELFGESYSAKYPKATNCLRKDREMLLAFYDFPEEHCGPLRATNPIESTFATVRLRTVRIKGSGSRIACLTMVFKLVKSASKHWRSLNGSQLLSDAISGIRSCNGLKATTTSQPPKDAAA